MQDSKFDFWPLLRTPCLDRDGGQSVFSTSNGRSLICVPCCHNQPKVGNDFFELISSSDAEEKELSSKSKIVFL